MKDFATYPALADTLPALVRKQQKAERLIASIGSAIKDEKATRDAIDVLLVEAGILVGEGVTCNGYDVTHHARAGNSFTNVLTLAQLGVSIETIAAALDYYATSYSAHVKPSKGASVRKRASA